jgi:hypothetical protein
VIEHIRLKGRTNSKLCTSFNKQWNCEVAKRRKLKIERLKIARPTSSAAGCQIKYQGLERGEGSFHTHLFQLLTRKQL